MDPDRCEDAARALRSVAWMSAVTFFLGGIPVAGAISAVALLTQMRSLMRHLDARARAWMWIMTIAVVAAGAANAAAVTTNGWSRTVLGLATGAALVAFLCAMLDWIGGLGWQWPLEQWRRATWLAAGLLGACLLAFVVASTMGGWPAGALALVALVLGMVTWWSVSGALRATVVSLQQAADHYRSAPEPATV